MFGATTFLPLALALAALAGVEASSPHGNQQVAHAKRVHANVAREAIPDGVPAAGEQERFELAVGTNHTLAKRAFSGRATFFEPGLGACGTYSSASDYIVALNVAQYGDLGAVSPMCFQTITVSYGGKTAQCQVTDACPSCPYGGLDMSPALFRHFASEDVGVFYMSWTLGSGDPAPAPTTTTQAPPPPPPTTTRTTTTSAWTPPPTTSQKPTTTYSPPPPSTTTTRSTTESTSSSTTSSSSSTTSSTSSSSSTSTNSTSSTSSASSSTPGSGSAAAQATPYVAAGGNLDSMQNLLVAMGQLANAAVEAAKV